jgi:serine acetyltransferase
MLSRVAQLKLLNEILRELFDQGVNEDAAFNQVSADARFERVRRATVKSIYDGLRKKVVNAHKKLVAKYLNKTASLCYSTISLEFEMPVGEIWTWGRKFMIDQRFVITEQCRIEHLSSYCLILVDTFNNRFK